MGRAEERTGLLLELTFYAALMIGLLGSAHCLGMCGGIVGALSTGLQQSAQKSGKNSGQKSLVTYLLTYNAGRILTYTFAGLLAGLLGAQAARFSLNPAVPIGRLIAGLFMITLGLYLADWWRIIASLEKVGLHLWRRIEPLGRRFLPAKTPAHAFGLGLIWGWLPCGLVYSALAMAMVSASPSQGAMIMFGFGLGTLPMLLAMGGAAEQLRKFIHQPVVRQIAGCGDHSVGHLHLPDRRHPAKPSSPSRRQQSRLIATISTRLIQVWRMGRMPVGRLLIGMAGAQ